MQNTNTTVPTINTTAAAADQVTVQLTRKQVKDEVALISTKFTDMTVQTLDDLSAKRDAWEQGAFKKANEELYVLLAETLDVFLTCEDFVTTTKTKAHGKTYASALRSELSERLKAMGVKVQQNSSTLTMLVRFVFKSDRKRAQGYSQVLGAAIQDGIEPADLPNYISNAGGVEQIKRRMVLSAAALEKRAQIATATTGAKTEMERAELSPLASVQLVSEGQYAVLLAKPRADGFTDIIGVLSEVEQTLVNALLVRIAKKRVASGVIEPVGQMTDSFALQVAANDEARVKHG